MEVVLNSQNEEEIRVSKEKLIEVVNESMQRMNIGYRRLGELSKTGPSYAQRLLRGEPGPAENLGAVSEYFGFSPGYLLEVLMDYKELKPSADARLENFTNHYRQLDSEERAFIENLVDLFYRRHKALEMAEDTAAAEGYVTGMQTQAANQKLSKTRKKREAGNVLDAAVQAEESQNKKNSKKRKVGGDNSPA